MCDADTQGFVVSGLLLAGVVGTASPAGAATITFQNLNLEPGQTAIEDGMRYTVGAAFIVRTVVGTNQFIGNPPSGLLGTPMSSGTFNVTRADNGDFTFDPLRLQLLCASAAKRHMAVSRT